MVIFLYGSILAVMFLYVNIVDTIKKIKNDEDTGWNTVFGSIAAAFILYSLICICAR